jgi:hypothetical protein
MNEKLKLLLIILENSALYYATGIWVGFLFSWKMFLYHIFPFMVAIAILEGIFYKGFIFYFEIGGNVSDLERANVAWETLIRAVGWFFLGMVTAKTYLYEVGGHALLQ